MKKVKGRSKERDERQVKTKSSREENTLFSYCIRNEMEPHDTNSNLQKSTYDDNVRIFGLFGLCDFK